MIVPSASMTIHPVRMNGTVIAAPQAFNYFERIQERIVSFVAKNSRIDKEKFLNLMLKTGESCTRSSSFPRFWARSLRLLF